MSEWLNEVFIYPLGLLGLLAIPIVILIYLLRSRYKSKEVSSTFIWKRSLKYVKRRIPLNFIMSLLLILQILTVIAASVAIARPTIEPLESEEKIVILDASASMLAKDGDTTRFDNAKAMIEKASEQIGENSRMSLILAGEEAVRVITRTDNRGEFVTALKPLECTMQGANMTKALAVAGEVLSKNTAAKIVVYTDKEYIDNDGIEVVDCKRAGEWNAGVISLEEGISGDSYEFIANIGNYGLDSTYSVKLLINGNVVGQRTVTIEAGKILQIRFTSSTTDDKGYDEIRVGIDPVISYSSATVELSAKDSYDLDDSMTIYPKEKINPKILYVSKYVEVSNGKKNANKSLLYFALRANDFKIDSADMYKNIDEIPELKGYDLYIFEGVSPYELPEDGAVWLIDTPTVFTDKTGVEIGAAVEENAVDGYRIQKTLSADIVSEIVKNVDIDIPLNYGGEKRYAAVTTYRPITSLGSSFRPIYESNEQDVLIAGHYNSARMIISSFDFAKSSLIIFIADFPMLVRNMVAYSVPDLLTERTAPLGSEIVFEFPAGAKTIKRYYNGELANDIDVRALMATIEEEIKNNPELNVKDMLRDVFEIDLPGKYEIVVTYPDGDDSDTEDDVRYYIVTGHMPAEESIIVERVPTESLKYPSVDNGATAEYERIEIFPYVIAVLILLLILEWGVYYREQY